MSKELRKKSGRILRRIGTALPWIFLVGAVAGLLAYVLVSGRESATALVEEIEHRERLLAIEHRIETVVSEAVAFPFPSTQVPADEALIGFGVWYGLFGEQMNGVDEGLKTLREAHSGERTGTEDRFILDVEQQSQTARRRASAIKTAFEAGERSGAEQGYSSLLGTLHELERLIRTEADTHEEKPRAMIATRSRDMVRTALISMYLVLATLLLAVLYIKGSKRRDMTSLASLRAGIVGLLRETDANTGLPDLTMPGEIGRLARSMDDLVRQRGLIIDEQRVQIEKLRESYQRGSIAGGPSLGNVTERIVEMRNTEVAMLNLLEDLERERNLSREEAARIRTVITSIIDGVLMVGANGAIRLINPTARRMFGIDDRNVSNASYADVLPAFADMKGDALVGDSHPIVRALQTGQTANGQLMIEREEGTLPVSYRVAPVMDGEAKVGIVVVFRDIVDEVELDKAKSEFVSIASHQLRTPLNGIRWFIESILEGDFGEMSTELKQAVTDIHESSLHMAALIDTLLNVSRLESGRVKVEPKPCLLTDVVEEVLRDTEPTVKEKKLAIIKNFASDIPTIDLDINLIKIVIQNIMTNAIKYSRPKGDVTIDVVKEEDHVRVSVKDSGYGIPFKEQKNIFKKMFRAENVRAKQIDGNGLGLYIAKSVIEGFGGRIWFTSVEEKGTTFSITVPIVGMQAKEGDRTLIPEGGKGFTKTELRAARGE